MLHKTGDFENASADASPGHDVDEGEEHSRKSTTPPIKRRRLISSQDDSQGETQEQGQPADPVEPAMHVADRVTSVQEQASESEPCSICLESLVAQPLYELPSCRHAFHVSCLLQAFRRSQADQLRCPMCRGTGAETTNLRQALLSTDEVQDNQEACNPGSLCFQLFSESPVAASGVVTRFRQRCKAPPEYRLAKLQISELRTLASAMHALGRRDVDPTGDSANTFLLGRKELTGKVPRSLSIKTLVRGVKEAVHVLRFMSRDAILIEIVQGAELLCCFPLTLGFHFKRRAEQTWTWISEGQSAHVGQGDKVSLISVSPRGSATTAPPCCIQANDFGCILGLRLEGVCVP
eukprot:TRINITY_DN43408_c0_g1_i1.p1 TRINITY_DN43408_c0_g1~~TRINITY_DN43408_c0_g1_i1.p1  ORF type:complete len:350 (+),score=44.46 TRINITY_DN43408_c0_g1_i1:92-1141(+)